MEEKQLHDEINSEDDKILVATYDESVPETPSKNEEEAESDQSSSMPPVSPMRQIFYDSIKNEIYEYSIKNKLTAYLFWLVTGIFGGHRYYLGRNRSATIMMFTIGGASIWWLVDLFLIPKMLRQYNADQLDRKKKNLPPIELDQFELVESAKLLTIPDWSGYQRRKYLKYIGYVLNFPWILAFILTFAPILIFKILPLPQKMRPFRDKLFHKAAKVLEITSLISLSYILAYIAGYNFILEIGLLVLAICALMAFPDFIFKYRDKKLVHSLLKWDYLYRSYYFKHPPCGFFESISRSVLNVFMVMFGDKKARMEFNLYIGMIVILGAITTLLLPIDIFNILMAHKGDFAESVTSFINMFVKDFYMTLTWVALFLPTLGGTFAKYELKQEKRHLKYTSLLALLFVAIGFVYGMIKADNFGLLSGTRSLIGL